MTVYFIGAGPGAADLLTVRAARLLAEATCVIYAGSLISTEVLAIARKDARRVNSYGLDLSDLLRTYAEAESLGQDVARLHSGDLSLFSAAHEQMMGLRHLRIPWEVVPGVTAFSGCAAALNQTLTIPEVAQTVVLTRAGRAASAMPGGDALASHARGDATLCIHLSGGCLADVIERLLPAYGGDCACAWVHRASQPGEQVVRATLASVLAVLGERARWRVAMLLVGPALATWTGEHRSHLYRRAGG